LSKRLIPALTGRDPDFARLQREFFECAIDSARDRAFQQMFEAVMRHWQSSDDVTPDYESWPAFRQRVAGVLQQIQQSARPSTRTVVFTSGGVIGCLLQHALGVSDSMMRELCWRVRNASLTDFLFTPERFTLDAFNLVPHLNTPELLTYR
jgi:broad specificity phosphatase PhoE